VANPAWEQSPHYPDQQFIRAFCWRKKTALTQPGAELRRSAVDQSSADIIKLDLSSI